MITRPAPVGPAKQRASNHVRRLAKEVARTFPDMSVHQHLTDAAHEIDGGRMDNAKRHLDAAISSFAPLQLMRHGIHDDEGHRAAKDFMNQAHRGRLLVMDAQSMQGENDGLAERRKDAQVSALQARAMRNAQPDPAGKTGKDVASPDAPDKPGSHQIAASWDSVLHAIELAGKTPPHETASGRRALKAKGQTAYGTSFPVPNISYLKKAINSIGRAPAAKRGVLKSFLKRRAAALGAPALAANLTAEQLAAIDLAVSGGQVIDLVGPKGYEHGWHYVGGPGLPSSPGGGSGRRRIFMGGKQVSTHAYQQAMNANAQIQGLKTPFPHAGMPVTAHQEPLGLGHIPLSQAGQYDGMEGIRGALGNGKGVVTGTYNHRTETIRDSRGHVHKVISVDPSAARAGYHGSMNNPNLPAGLKAYDQALKTGAVYRQLYKTYRGPNAQPGAQTVQFSGWDRVVKAIELSADTGRLASTPHPFGKPGGPGLWDVKNMELPPYIQNIARALLRTGRAKTLSQAIAIAKGATNRWSKGGGHVSPEVRAASTATNADWDAKRARARAHTADVLSVIELYNPAGNPSQARVPQGQTGGGQFTTGGGGGAPAGKGGAGQSRAQRKAALLATAKADRARAKMLAIKIAADRAALAAASGKKISAQKGAVTTAKAATTGSGTPAAKGAAAAASPMSAANTGLSPKAVAAATVAAKAQAGKMSKGQLIAAIRAMSTQEKNLLAQAAQAAAQAAKL